MKDGLVLCAHSYDPAMPMIDVVPDNLNTHAAETFIEIYGKAEADRLLAHLKFHFTPLRASWLNIAEIELSALTGQCLDGRLGDEWRLVMDISAWESRRNELYQPVTWSFTWKRARRMFRKRGQCACATTSTGQN